MRPNIASKDIRGIHIGSLQSLRPMLKQWQEIIEWWDAKNTEHDASWWYNERASISQLAGAVWRCDGWAFEEFGTEKISAPNGRCDIAFGFGRRNFWGEAKQCWPALSQENYQAKEMVEKHLRWARDEVLEGITGGYTGLAITFVSSKIAPSTADNIGIDAVIKDLVRQLRAIQNVTLAWTFPVSKRNLKSELGKYKGYYFPGAVVAILPVNSR